MDILALNPAGSEKDIEAINARLEKLGLSEEDVSLDEAADEVMAPEEAAAELRQG